MTETKTAPKRPATLDHLKKKKPLEREVVIVLDDDAILAVGKADDRLREVQSEFDTWLAAQRDMQMRTLQTLPQARREVFLLELPDPPGYSDRFAALEAAKEALSAAEEGVRKASTTIVFRSIGRKAYEALVDSHPPTDEQNALHVKENDGQPAPYNGDTFPPALISASAVSPLIPLEDALQMWDEWNSNELVDLFTSALIVNTARRMSLGNG